MKEQMNEKLYQALIENKGDLADQWLKLREKRPNSLYSDDADEKYQVLLKEQNALTTKTITSSLLEDKKEYKLNLEQWANMVAQSRADMGTPIYEVLEAVHYFPSSNYEFLNTNVAEHDEDIFSGIRPEVAMTSVQLGIDLKEIKTFSTLQQALQKMGLHI